jgi:3-hydroxyisobutyrate dehydrogenase-like beta-hydroxyacid dehydrogenase
VEIGFIGLGPMGFPMARRLIQANHRVVAFDARAEVLYKVAELGAQPASSPKEVADLAETVIAMRDEGADSDFTSAIKPNERAAGVIVGPVGASTPEPGE